MTETSSQTSTLASEDAFLKMGSAGKPLFFNQIIIDAPNKEGIGEILVRSTCYAAICRKVQRSTDYSRRLASYGGYGVLG